VDLAAPGEQIYSTSNTSDASYYPPFDFINVAGTSYAAPYVAGTCALLKARYPSDPAQQIISRVLYGTDPLPSLAGKCATAGRLNLRKALSPPLELRTVSATGTLPFQLRVVGGPYRTCTIEVTTNLVQWSALVTNTTSAGGTYDYVDLASTDSPRRFFRAVAAP
jgi:subtilisin family serine protease